MDSFKYKYAEFGTHFLKPEYSEDQVYIVPKGLMKRHDTRKIVSIEKRREKQLNIQLIKVIFNVLRQIKNMFMLVVI